MLLAPHIEVGEMNGLRIRVYGSKAGLVWRQEEPNSMTLHRLGGISEWIRAGEPGLTGGTAAQTRTPGGHPEGYLEAFANLYRDFAAKLRGEDAPLLPGVAEGVRGMQFIDRAVKASRDRNGWVPFPDKEEKQ